VAAAPSIDAPFPASTRVGAAMHRGVITCAPAWSGLKVAKTMAAHRIHSVVLPGAGTPPMLVTDAEIITALNEGTLAAKCASELAKPALILTRDETLLHATRCLYEHGATHAVVVADLRSFRPVGMLSVLDIAELLVEGSGA
jgi:predicted transcriptional regulator